MNDTIHNAVLMQQLKENSRWFFWLGILLIALGTLAIMFSTVSTLITIEYLALFLVMLGFVEIAKTFNMRSWKGFFFSHLFVGLLFVIAGIFMMLNPMSNAIMLTLFWSLFFIVAGTIRIFTALTHTVPHQGIMILSGAINMILGILVFSQWPASGLWVIGLFVGIDVLFAGWSLVALSSMTKTNTQS